MIGHKRWLQVRHNWWTNLDMLYTYDIWRWQAAQDESLRSRLKLTLSQLLWNQGRRSSTEPNPSVYAFILLNVWAVLYIMLQHAIFIRIQSQLFSSHELHSKPFLAASVLFKHNCIHHNYFICEMISHWTRHTSVCQFGLLPSLKENIRSQFLSWCWQFVLLMAHVCWEDKFRQVVLNYDLLLAQKLPHILSHNFSLK